MSLKLALEKLKVVREFELKDENEEVVLTLPYRVCNFKESLNYTYLAQIVFNLGERKADDKLVFEKDLEDYEDGTIKLFSTCLYYPDNQGKNLTEADARELYLALSPKQTGELIEKILGNPAADKKL